ncbi:tetratricopeptide repeat protein, partial [Candidatus Hodarchaeum mangrovi]
WFEFREGQYSRVIGLLSNISIDIEKEDPLFTTLYSFILLLAFIESRESPAAENLKERVVKQLNQNKFKDHRFYSGFLEMALGIYHNRYGDLEKSRKFLESSYVKFKVFSNYYFLFHIGENLGLLSQKERDYEKAVEIFKDLLKMRKSLQTLEIDPFLIYRVVNNLADLSYELGDLDLAVTYAKEAVDLFQQFKLPSLDAIFQLSQLYSIQGFIDKAKENLENGLNQDWISRKEIDDPDYYRVLATIEKYACNFGLALEYYNHALRKYKKSRDISNILECLADEIILHLEIFFWRKQGKVLEEAILLADEFRSLVEGQEIKGWSYTSKVIQAIPRAFSGDPMAKKLLEEAQKSKDINFFGLEHKKLLNIDIMNLSTSPLDALNAIEFLTSLQNRAHRDSWIIEEKKTNLQLLVVLDSESSLPIFLYYFDRSLNLDRLLISGLISAINTMSRTLSLKELNEIHYQDSLVLIAHRHPLLFALICDEQANIGIRLKFLQLRETFPDINQIPTQNFQIDLSESTEIQKLVQDIFYN